MHPDAVTVFIGPCLSKIFEADDPLAGGMVDQVLKGTDVADIPVKQFKSDLSIYVNRDVMEALGITLPDSIANSENLVMMEQE